MPVFRLPKDILVFPHPSLAEQNGLLGFGGELSAESILLAYQNGIFPWNNQDEELLWWFLSPRMVLYPQDIKISQSMLKLLKKGSFSIRYDTDFEKVIDRCGSIKRLGQEGTWIHQKLKKVFLELHRLGYAHSVEVWDQNHLVGGLYGLLIGKMFCGESMFSERSNMSKIALIKLCEKLQQIDADIIDCQQVSPHLQSMGATTLSKRKFLQYLETNKLNKNRPCLWNA